MIVECDIALVENNPYDRAVVAAALAGMEGIRLIYSVKDQGTLYPLGPLNFEKVPWEKECKIALLDLALTAECEKGIASGGIRAVLTQKEYAVQLRSLAQAIAAWRGVSVQIAEILWSLARLEKGLPSLFGREAKEEVLDEYPELVKEACRPLTEWISNGRPADDLPAARGLVHANLLDQSQGAVADIVASLAKFPSLGRLLAIVAANPDVFFIVVSHYADAEAKWAIANMLIVAKGRQDCPTDWQKYVVSKSALEELPQVIDEVRSHWRDYKSPLEEQLGPFSSMPLAVRKQPRTGRFTSVISRLLHRGTPRSIRELLEDWKRIAKRPEALHLYVLWDKSGCLAGAQYSLPLNRWHELMGGPPPIAVVNELAGIATRSDGALIIQQWQEGENKGVALAGQLEQWRCNHIGNRLFVVAGGDSEALSAFEGKISEDCAIWTIVPGKKPSEVGGLMWGIMKRTPVISREDDLIPAINNKEAKTLEVVISDSRTAWAQDAERISECLGMRMSKWNTKTSPWDHVWETAGELLGDVRRYPLCDVTELIKKHEPQYTNKDVVKFE